MSNVNGLEKVCVEPGTGDCRSGTISSGSEEQTNTLCARTCRPPKKKKRFV